VFALEGVVRLFQRSTACLTVGALGPKAKHSLHTTNFGSMSLLIQTSEPPQKGQPQRLYTNGESAQWIDTCAAATFPRHLTRVLVFSPPTSEQFGRCCMGLRAFQYTQQRALRCAS
jgi:hypothetical protein